MPGFLILCAPVGEKSWHGIEAKYVFILWEGFSIKFKNKNLLLIYITVLPNYKPSCVIHNDF